MIRIAIVLPFAACAAAPHPAPRDVGIGSAGEFLAPALAGWDDASLVAAPPLTFRRGDAALYGLRLETDAGVQRWLVEFEVAAAPDPRARFVRRYAVGEVPVDVASVPVEVRVTVRDESGKVVQVGTAFAGDTYLRTGTLAASDLAIARGWRTGTPAPYDHADAQAMVPAVMGLYELFTVLQGCDALAPLVMQVVRKPSAWSVLTSWGVTLALEARLEEAVAADGAAFSASRCLRYPARIFANGALALEAALFVVAPMPPSHLSAGIVAIDAWHPEEPGRRFRMRLLAGRRA